MKRTFLPIFLFSLLSICSLDAQIYINEFLASNGTGITDEAGDFEDWIEIYNAGATDVDLAGYYISDDILEPLLWQIPTGSPALTTVPAGGYLILWADKDVADGANHIDIKLGAGGEDIILTNPDAVTVEDQYTFGPQTEDTSNGRETDGASNFVFFPNPSPGAENVAGDVPTFTIMLEIPIASGLDDGEEFPGGGVILNSSDIEMVEDQGSAYTAAFRFTNIGLPADAIINNAYLQFVADEVQIGSANITLNAELSPNAGALQSVNGNITSRTTTAAASNWIPAPWPTIGESGADQQTPDLSDLVAEVIANPGWDAGNAMVFILSGSGTRTTYAYDSNPTNAAKLIIEAEVPLPTDPIPTVYINEVSANSSTYTDEGGTKEDWVEIYNPNAEDADLGGLFLTDKFSDLDKWQISPGTIVPAGGYLIFFTDNDDEEGPLHTNFSLKAGGEDVALSQLLADGLTIIDSLSYEDMPFMATYGRETDGATNLVLFGQVTPDASNNGADLYLPAPEFSIPSGAYTSTQSVSITSPESGTNIYYTTDGSYPDINSTLYNGSPISISTTSSLRAIATKAGYANSQPSDVTYLINEDNNIPILYITTDPDNFFDDEIGIYVDGTNGVIAYCATEPVNWAQDWERPINLKMFMPDGELAFDVEAGVEINGACSRNRAMKSLGINLRDKEFGDEAIEYPLFPERDHNDYQRLKIRNSGQDFIRLGFRDMVNQNMITGKLDIDLQAGRPSLLYINGEFWGIHNIREKYAGEYFEAIYGVNENDLDIIKSPGLPWRDEKKGTDDIYNALFDVVENSDMTNDTDWDYFQSQVDVNEMMNYWITMTYMNNYDWPANNLTVWRERADGAKWRYGMADTDGSTQNNLTSDAEPSYNKFALINDPNITNWPNHSNSTLFLRKSLDRPEFRDEFIQRSCSVIELIYNEDRVTSFIDEMVALFEPNVQNHIDRWGFDNAMGGDISNWNNYIELYRGFYDERPDFWRQHVNDFYNLDGYYDLTVNFDANSGGDVFVNTNEMEIPYNYVGTYFQNIPLRLKAVAQPGYVFQFWLETGDTNAEIDFVGNSNTTLTPIFELLDCAEIEPGTPCNDGDVCTTDDVYDVDCNCAGIFADEDTDGVCDAEDQCPGFDDNIDLNNNGIPDGCDVNCTDADGDLVCADDDCDDNNPNIPTTPGTTCDDGNAQTDNDMILADGCTCQGEITPPSGEYCDAQGDAPWLEWIAGIQLNDLSNTSSKTQYTDYTNLFATLDAGTTYDLTLTTGFSWTAYEEYFRVWIDYNQNNVFDEPGEIAYSGILSGVPNATETADLLGSINVPADAMEGTTRMRVSMQRGAYAAPCGSFPNGEVEDYSVIINIGDGTILTVNNCPSNIEQTAEVGQTSMVANWTAPTASTTCDPNTVSINQTAGPANGSSFDIGTTTTITYTITDECGNEETCSFIVTINAADMGTLTLNCPANIEETAGVGETDMVVNWATPNPSTTCAISTVTLNQTAGPASGSSFNVGTTTTITYTATDECGNNETCSFTVTINAADMGTLTLNCPANIEETAGVGETSMVVNWTAPNPSTTCAISTITLNQTAGPASGSSFDVGTTTTITYTATDECGNNETCSFTVTVNAVDNGSITLTCPSDISVVAEVGQTGAVVNWTAASGSSTCPSDGLIITQTGGQPSGSFFEIGDYQILYNATDACGNDESCTFNITVLPGETGGEYCESEGDFPWHEWISNVQVNTLNNISGKNRYSDFTNLSTDLSPSLTYDINLTTGYSYTTYDEYWKVWIDYNQDGIFQEPAEVAYSGILSAPANGTPSATINGLISVPVDAATGLTRMRVSMKRGAEPGPCELFGFGEVEDYSVNIIAGNLVEDMPQNFARAQEDIEVFPNPAARQVNVVLEKNMNLDYLEIFNIASKKVHTTLGIEEQKVYQFNVNNWPEGIYFIHLRLIDGRRITKRIIVNED